MEKNNIVYVKAKNGGRMNENIIECVVNYLNNDDFKYHTEDGVPYKELSIEERDILSAYIIQLQRENEKYKEVIDNIKYYLEQNGNQMSEDANYDLLNFIKEV